MSSTESRARAARLYEKFLIPAAALLRADGSAYFRWRPDPAAVSYYSPRQRGEYVFEASGPDALTLEDELAHAPGPPLAPMAQHVRELATELRRLDAQEVADVSPLIYPMF